MKEILDLNDLNLNDLSKNTIAQLREFGKELGIKSVTRYRKSELIDKIQEKLTEMSKSQMKQMEAEVPPEEQAAEGQEQAAAEQPVKKKERSSQKVRKRIHISNRVSRRNCSDNLGRHSAGRSSGRQLNSRRRGRYGAG